MAELFRSIPSLPLGRLLTLTDHLRRISFKDGQSLLRHVASTVRAQSRLTLVCWAIASSSVILPTAVWVLCRMIGGASALKKNKLKEASKGVKVNVAKNFKPINVNPFAVREIGWIQKNMRLSTSESLTIHCQHGIHVEDDDVVFDVGAHIGLFSLWIGHNRKRCKIFAFEPLLPSFIQLFKNVMTHGLSRRSNTIPILNQQSPSTSPVIVPIPKSSSSSSVSAPLSLSSSSVALDLPHSNTSVVKIFPFGLYHRSRDNLPFTYFTHIPSLSSCKPENSYWLHLYPLEFLKCLNRGVYWMTFAMLPFRWLLTNYTRSYFGEVALYYCQVRTLSEVMVEENLDHIDLLKINTQGCELEVLLGISPDHWPCIKQIVLELHNEDQQLDEVLEILRKNQFTTVVEQVDWAQGFDLPIFLVFAENSAFQVPSPFV